MSLRLDWNSSYQTGVELIDLQHHYFLDLIHRMESELCCTDDPHYIMNLLTELVKYAQFHFVSEENFMYKIGYPELKNHRQQHFTLLDQLNGKLGLFKESLLPAEDVIDFLKQWFVEHTLKEDMKIALAVR